MKAEYVDHMGTDLSVVNAARVSFDKVSEWGETYWDADEHIKKHVLSEKDAKLIKFLADHHHELPFAHTAITLRMKAPVPIRTQCFKHKVGFVENEESRRYIKGTPEVYYPEVWRKAAASVKQGSSEEEVLVLEMDYWGMTTSPKTLYKDVVTHCINSYEWLVRSGVCPEQARFVLPQGVYVNWIWTGSLLAFSRYYNLRTDPHAQKESQELAVAVGSIIEPLFPVSWKALTQ